MVIYEEKMVSGVIKAVFDDRTLKLKSATRYSGKHVTRKIRKGGVLWSRLQANSRRYLYERNR